jgi:hypothetical protein
MHGPTSIFRADLTPCSLSRAVLPAAYFEGPRVNRMKLPKVRSVLPSSHPAAALFHRAPVQPPYDIIRHGNAAAEARTARQGQPTKLDRWKNSGGLQGATFVPRDKPQVRLETVSQNCFTKLFHMVGPSCAAWPGVLSEKPYPRPELGPSSARAISGPTPRDSCPADDDSLRASVVHAGATGREAGAVPSGSPSRTPNPCP